MLRYDGIDYNIYDAIGNPTRYMNVNESGAIYTFSWQNGRQLASGTKGETTFSYTYNADGLRTKKVVDGVTTEYYWAGSQLAMMVVNPGTLSEKVLKFYYDVVGSPFCFDIDGEIYFYITNLQGDVMQIVSESGSVYGWYEYDAWGKLLTMDGNSSSIAEALSLNPLRYRGYIYDSETEFYYLQSRYYDPAVGRFINADSASYLGATGTFLSFDLFAYCENNPVNSFDFTGFWTISIGVSATARCILGFSKAKFISIDSQGNVALQKSKSNFMARKSGIVMGLLSVGVSIPITCTEFESVSDLEGVGNTLSGTIKPMPVSAGVVMDSDWEKQGYNISIPIADILSWRIDASLESAITETEWKFNVFDVADTVGNFFKGIWSRVRKEWED